MRVRSPIPRYAYLDENSIVVNLIVGQLTPDDEQAVMEQQRAAFNAVAFVQVDHNVRVMIGALYDLEANEFVFFEPPQPDTPESTVEPEIIIEPEVTTNADQAIE